MITDYKNKIEQAVKKYAPDKTEDEQQDIQQECYLALLEAGDKIEGKPGYAFRVIQNRIFDLVGKKSKKTVRLGNEAVPVKNISLTDPDVFRKTENQTSVIVDLGDDAEALIKAVQELPIWERVVVIHRFGLFDNKAKSRKRLAELMHVTQDWIRWQEKKGLKELKSILKGGFK